MDAAYFKKQIEDYASGRRASPEMEPYAKQTLDLGVDHLAAFFAGKKMERTPIRADAAAVARGRQAAGACASCHGADGRGDRAKVVPGLAGQAPGYLRTQMLSFKRDQRKLVEPAKAVMKSVSDASLADLAAYYSSVTR
jgi:cytochrome c553